MESELSDSLISSISNDINFQFFNKLSSNETELRVDPDPKFDKLPKCDKVNAVCNKGSKGSDDENDDVQSLVGSDFMFNIDSDFYEDILSVDCLDSILDCIPFCNEGAEKKLPCVSDISFDCNGDNKQTKNKMLYDSDISLNQNEGNEKTEEEIQFDNEREDDECVNVVSDPKSVKLVPDPAFNCDIVNNPENGYTTENLENIVPNFNASSNSVVNNSFNNTTMNKISEAELLNKSFQNYFYRLINDKEANPNISNKQIKNTRFDFLSDFVSNEPIIVNKQIKRQILFFSKIPATEENESSYEDTTVKINDYLSDGKDTEPAIIDQLVESLWINYINGLSADEVAEPSIIDKLVDSFSIDYFDKLTDEKTDLGIDTLANSPIMIGLSSLTDSKETEHTLIGQLVESLWVNYFRGSTADEVAEPSILDNLIESLSVDYFNEITDEDSDPSVIDNLLEDLKIGYLNELVDDEKEPVVKKAVEHLTLDYCNDFNAERNIVNKTVERTEIDFINNDFDKEDVEASIVHKLVELPGNDLLNELIGGKEAEMRIVNKPVESTKIDSFNEFVVDDDESESNIVDKLVERLRIDHVDELTSKKEADRNSLDKPFECTESNIFNEFIVNEESDPSIVDRIVERLRLRSCNKVNKEDDELSVVYETVESMRSDSFNDNTFEEQVSHSTVEKLIEYLKFDSFNKSITEEDAEGSSVDKPVESIRNDIFDDFTDEEASPSTVDKLVKHLNTDSFNNFASNKDTELNIVEKVSESANCFDEFTSDEEVTSSMLEKQVDMLDMIDSFNELITSGKKADSSSVDKTISTIDSFEQYSAEEQAEPSIAKKLIESTRLDSFDKLTANEEAELETVDKPCKSSSVITFNDFITDKKVEPSSVCQVAKNLMNDTFSEDISNKVPDSSTVHAQVECIDFSTTNENAKLNISDKSFESFRLDLFNDFASDEKTLPNIAEKVVGSSETHSFDEIIATEEVEPNGVNKSLESLRCDAFNDISSDEQSSSNTVDNLVQSLKIDSLNEFNNDENDVSIVHKPVASSVIDSLCEMSADKEAGKSITSVQNHRFDFCNGFTIDKNTKPVTVENGAESIIYEEQVEFPIIDFYSDLTSDENTKSNIGKTSMETANIDYLCGLTSENETVQTIADKRAESPVLHGETLVEQPVPVSVDKTIDVQMTDYSRTLTVNKGKQLIINSSGDKGAIIDYLSEVVVDKEQPTDQLDKNKMIDYFGEETIDIDTDSMVKPVESLMCNYLSPVPVSTDTKSVVDKPVNIPIIDYLSEFSVDEIMEPFITDKVVRKPMDDHLNLTTNDNISEQVIVKPITDSSSDFLNELSLDKQTELDVVDNQVKSPSKIVCISKGNEVIKTVESTMIEYSNELSVDQEMRPDLLNRQVESSLINKDYANVLDKDKESVTFKSVESSMIDFLNDITVDNVTESAVNDPVKNLMNDCVIINDNGTKPAIVNKPLKLPNSDNSITLAIDKEIHPVTRDKQVNSYSNDVVTVDQQIEPMILDKEVKNSMIDYSNKLTVDQEIESVILGKQIKSSMSNYGTAKTIDRETESVNVKSSIVDYINGINFDEEIEPVVNKPVKNLMNNSLSLITIANGTKSVVVNKPIISVSDCSIQLTVNKETGTTVDKQVKGPNIDYSKKLNVNQKTQPVILDRQVKNSKSNHGSAKFVDGEIESENVKLVKSSIVDYINGLNFDDEEIEPIVDKPANNTIDYFNGITIEKVTEPIIVYKPISQPTVDYSNGFIANEVTNVDRSLNSQIVDYLSDKNVEPVIIDKSVKPPGIVDKPMKRPRIGAVDRDTGSISSKNSRKNSRINCTAENNNNVELNNNIVVHNVSDNYAITNNNIPANNLPIIGLKNAKVLDSHKKSMMSDNSTSVPVKKFKDANGLPSVVLYVKKSQVEGLRKQPFLLNGVQVNSVTKSKECVLKNLSEPVEVSQEITLGNKVQSVESVNTNNENGGYKTVGNANFNVLDKRKLQKNKNIMDLPDKLKKPELFNDRLLFSFSVTSRRLSSGTLNFDTFQKDNAVMKYYTGIPKYSYFMALLHCLKLPVNDVVSPFQMLLLTLMKLRLNLDWVDLAYRFGKNVQVVQETFGITLYILVKCLSQLVCWSLKEKRDKYGVRKHATLFVYSLKANLSKEEELKRIFICLSANNHPIHIVSKAVPDNECTNGLDILATSGIMEKLVLRDLVLFDKEIDYLPTDEGRSALSVLSDDHDSFCTQPYVNDQNKLGKMEETVSEIKQYKFLYGTITCGWADECSDKLSLFNNAVTVVCSIVNLCSVLPFTKNSVTSIISERNTMNILIT